MWIPDSKQYLQMKITCMENAINCIGEELMGLEDELDFCKMEISDEEDIILKETIKELEGEINTYKNMIFRLKDLRNKYERELEEIDIE